MVAGVWMISLIHFGIIYIGKSLGQIIHIKPSNEPLFSFLFGCQLMGLKIHFVSPQFFLLMHYYLAQLMAQLLYKLIMHQINIIS
jgi:hypothetical protein